MDIRIFDRNLRLCGICDCAVSWQASRQFAGAGTCTVRVPLAEAGRFAADCILRFPGDAGDFLIRSIREDSAAGTAVIGGVGLLSYFERRAVTEPVMYAGAAEELLCSLAGTWGGAVLPGRLRAVRSGMAAKVSAAVASGSLLDVLSQICTAAGVGMRLTLDADAGAFRFEAVPRRTVPLFLSRSAGNLTGAVRVVDFGDYRSRAIIRGADGRSVTVDAAGLFDDGVDDGAQPLREIFSEESGLSQARFETEAAYLDALTARGRLLLAQHRPRQSLSVQVDEAAARQLTPGDVCPISDAALGIETYALCTARTLSHTGASAVMSVV